MEVMKCVVIGDEQVGKTSLLATFIVKDFSGYVPTIVDHHSLDGHVEDRPYTLTLHNTAGQERYAHLRALAYPSADIFLVCMSVVSPSTINSVKDIWVPEITSYFRKSKVTFIVCEMKD